MAAVSEARILKSRAYSGDASPTEFLDYVVDQMRAKAIEGPEALALLMCSLNVFIGLVSGMWRAFVGDGLIAKNLMPHPVVYSHLLCHVVSSQVWVPVGLLPLCCQACQH